MIREVDHGLYVEKRYYNDEGKLVEIRKAYPPNTHVKPTSGAKWAGLGEL